MESITSQFFTYVTDQKGSEFSNDLREVLNNISELPFDVIIKKRKRKRIPAQDRPRCLARCSRGNNQCSRHTKNGEDQFCGLHTNYAKPTKCNRCSKKSGEDVFHSAKWEHHGRIDEEIPAHIHKKAKKMKKNGGKAKRATTAYLQFINANRASVKKENPSLSPTQMTSFLAKKWKETSATERKPFVQIAADDKVRYDNEMKLYKSDAKPKRGKSAYNIFVQNKRSEVNDKHPEANSKEVMTLIGAVWKNTSDSDRKEYYTLAAADKQRYTQEIAEWNQKHPVTKDSSDADGEVSVRDKANTKPLTAYRAYIQSQIHIVQNCHPELSTKEVKKIIRTEWKNVSKEDRKIYADIAAADKTRIEHLNKKVDVVHKMITSDDDDYSADDGDDELVWDDNIEKLMEMEMF